MGSFVAEQDKEEERGGKNAVKQYQHLGKGKTNKRKQGKEK